MGRYFGYRDYARHAFLQVSSRAFRFYPIYIPYVLLNTSSQHCLFHRYRKHSAFVVGIGFITAISWFRNTAITYFPDTLEGDDRFDYFKQVVRIEQLDKLLAPFSSDFSGVGVALITFLYVDFLDTSVRQSIMGGMRLSSCSFA